MNKKILIIFIILALLGIVTAGAIILFPYDPLNPPVADDTGFTQEGIQEVVNSNNKFAFDMYQELNENTDNLFLSPFSIYSAIAMTYEGALEETKEEIQNEFYFPKKDLLRTIFAAIYNNINKKNKGYELKTGNALWTNITTKFEDDYLNTVENYYGGKATSLDFINDTENSRLIINDFIAQQTNDRIKDIISSSDLSEQTRLILTNAIYFKGKWLYEFEKKYTEDLDFKVNDNETIKTSTMSFYPKKEEFNYFENENVQLLELPYIEEELSMLLLLPKEDMHTFEQDFVYNNFNEWKQNMVLTSLKKIQIPKFEFETKYYLKNNLNNLGMISSFTNLANFSKMTKDEDLFISDVIHQTFIKVDEEGTEAAAATAVVMEATSMPSFDKPVFKADKPFIFIIQEKDTGNILFLGRVTNPSS